MTGCGDRFVVGVQVALRGGERAVSGDLAEVVQVVAPEPVEAQRGDDVVPVRGVAQDRGGDPPAAGADEESQSGRAAARARRRSINGRTSGMRGTTRARFVSAYSSGAFSSLLADPHASANMRVARAAGSSSLVPNLSLSCAKR